MIGILVNNILMLLIVVSGISIYFYLKSSDRGVFDRSVVWAIILMVIYLGLFALLAEFPQNGSARYWAGLFGVIPGVSLIAILFPQLNHETPEVLTRGWGLFGLGIMIPILFIVRWFVWS